MLLAIFLIARGCQQEGIEISQDEAIAIAREAVDFVPDEVQVRLLRRGAAFEAQWVVSLSQRSEDGGLTNITLVVVDARTGEVLDERRG